MSAKKKLVYKQDPDGVFRLKKLGDDDKLNTKSDKRTVDDYLNDLITCTYQVVDPHGHKDQTEKDTSDVETLESSDPKSIIPENPIHQSSNPIHQSISHSNPIHQPISHSREFTRDFNQTKEFSPGLQIMTPPTKPKIDFSSINMFHIPSFAVGLVIAVVLTHSAPWLTYYGAVAFNYFKVGIIWAVILGSIAWYTGIIKVEDFNSIRTKFIGGRRQIQMEEEIMEPPPLMAQASEVFEDFEPISRREPRPKSGSRKPPSPITRRSTTNVVPFKAPPRVNTSPAFVRLDDKSPSVPDLSNYDKPKITRNHTAEPKSNYSKFIERSRKHKPTNSMDSFDSHHLRQGPLTPPREHGLPGPDEDLPFINEVKLMNNDNEYVGELPTFNTLGRSNTTASKKSVLGTRVNYNKFIDSGDFEYD